MISVVIPVYNGEKYIEQCIDSVLNQSYTDLEIIVVNDGSTDRTEEILVTKYKDKIRYIYKANGGTASALNEGIKNMKGDWFKWLSADDMFNHKHVLRDIMVLISTIPDHQRYIFYTNYDIVNHKGELLKAFEEPDRKELGTDLRNAELMYNFYGNGSTSLIHRKLIDEVGLFREGMVYGEDLEYWIRACIKFKHTLYHLPLCSVKYRVHGDSLTNTVIDSKSHKALEEIKNTYVEFLTDKQIEYLRELNDNKPLRRKMLPFIIRSGILKIRSKI